MPRLTDTPVRNLKFVDKQYKRSDGQGLYLLVTAAGKYFRYDYRHSGKRNPRIPRMAEPSASA